MSSVLSGRDEVLGCVGRVFGPTEWRSIEQGQVDLFADATGDHQWIHVDPERAASGPFGTTMAHGYLTLSLLPSFLGELVRFEGTAMAVNYGLNTLRFPAPVPVGSRIRATARADAADETAGGSVTLVLHVEVEREGSDKPVLVADSLTRLYY